MSLGGKPTPHDIEVSERAVGQTSARHCRNPSPLCRVETLSWWSPNPRLEDGTPFPTLYYLTQPAATQAASRLEAEGKMAEYQERLARGRWGR